MMTAAVLEMTQDRHAVHRKMRRSSGIGPMLCPIVIAKSATLSVTPVFRSASPMPNAAIADRTTRPLIARNAPSIVRHWIATRTREAIVTEIRSDSFCIATVPTDAMKTSPATTRRTRSLVWLVLGGAESWIGRTSAKWSESEWVMMKLGYVSSSNVSPGRTRSSSGRFRKDIARESKPSGSSSAAGGEEATGIAPRGRIAKIAAL
mmetsp:Transcript_60875/g.144954  ORF Transcript_60875/g.144954 Transcript_60875/m.144954 type:complete len:206 (-) Transcript_60875:210-827(-)